MAIRDLKELTPNANLACTMFLEECEKAGLDILITETYRPQSRQEELYAQGRTKPGNIVTWTKNSRHTTRLAWDICKNVKGQEYSDIEFFNKAGAIAKKLGITWGGSWDTPDRPHFEIISNWKPREEDVEMEKIYNKVIETPDWSHEALNYYINIGAIADKDKLQMTLETIRILVIVYRCILKERK